MNCAIIGAGQLGSRHLQGLLTYSLNQLNVYVVDPSEESINLAQQKASEITHDHKLTFSTSLSEIPSFLDLVIIATNSKVRLSVLEDLVKIAKIRYLVLEKVLFPSVEQYDQALEIIKNYNIKCWVNHPRRMYDDYKNLKSYFSKDKIYSFQIVGASWGLACNALHFIDIFEYLTDSSLSILSCENLNSNPIESKRVGYIEFEGTINGMLNEKHLFSISSLSSNEIVAPSISIMTDNTRFFIQESGKSKIYVFDQSKGFKPDELDFTAKFQSQLTGKLLEQLIEKDSCDLTTFKHAALTHKIFIQSFLNHWNTKNNQIHTMLPIT